MKRNEDCDCKIIIKLFAAKYVGCEISEPPPKGYMCWCKYDFWGCHGDAMKCNGIDNPDPNSKACSGCTARQCCWDEGWNGNCNAYDM